MTLKEAIRDFTFYLRATERGLALVLMVGILTVRSIITDKPFFAV